MGEMKKNWADQNNSYIKAVEKSISSEIISSEEIRGSDLIVTEKLDFEIENIYINESNSFLNGEAPAIAVCAQHNFEFIVDKLKQVCQAVDEIKCHLSTIYSFIGKVPEIVVNTIREQKK